MFDLLKILGTACTLASILIAFALGMIVAVKNKREEERADETRSLPSVTITKVYGSAIQAGSYRR